jgi:ABC-type uncharacterized transport system involved in gliding motility auxiliary subunit
MALLLLLSGKIWTRADLTESRAYTLSSVSGNLYREIDEEVRISYYVSGRLKAMDPAPGEILDILKEYAARSRGKIKVFERDPSRGSYRQDAERYGLAPQQISNMEQDEASIAMVYSGIVIEYLNRIEVLPLVFSPETLEYNITSRIRSVLSGKKRELGIIAADPQKPWDQYYGYLNQELIQSGYSVQLLRPGEEIPDTLPALFVLGGAEELEEYDIYRIDRYIRMGGRVLFATESVGVDFFNTGEARLFEDRGLLAMISFYGVTIGQSLVLDLSSLSFPYQDRYTGEISKSRYPFWLEVLGEFSNQEQALSSGPLGPDMYWASPLTFTLPESGKVRGERLFTTTPDAWLMSRDFTVMPEMSSRFSGQMEETRGTQILAAALEGTFPSWFEGVDKPVRGGFSRPPDVPELPDYMEGILPEFPEETSGPSQLPDMPPEAGEARIIVIGDSDLAGSLLQFTQNQRNLDFLLKAADWLSNDDDIVGIRNRRSYAGRLDRITERTGRIGAVIFSQALNVFIVPLAVIIFGIIRSLKRKSGVSSPGVSSPGVSSPKDHADAV